MCHLLTAHLRLLKLSEGKKFRQNKIETWTGRKKILVCSTKTCTMFTRRKAHIVKIGFRKNKLKNFLMLIKSHTLYLGKKGPRFSFNKNRKKNLVANLN